MAKVYNTENLDPFDRIGIAVIAQAAYDLRTAIRRKNTGKVIALKKFFYGKDFDFWSNANGIYVYEKILKEETNEENKTYIRDLLSR